jgi:uncharacterized protein (DUF488 family)
LLNRQKILLNLVAGYGRPTKLIVLVKLAFLLRQEYGTGLASSFYEFVPYKFGPYSFVLYHELLSLVRLGYLDREGQIFRISGDYPELANSQIDTIPRAGREAVKSVMDSYSSSPVEEIIRTVYEKYPWFTIRSHLRRFLPTTVPEPPTVAPAVFTLGYEGMTLDGFLNLLLLKGMSQVLDVRADPVSRNLGFSKGPLSEACARLDIGYLHAPDLGVPRALRRAIHDGESRSLVFRTYAATLERQSDSLRLAGEAVTATPTVLVCFEKSPGRCHRSVLADVMQRTTNLPVIHLRE